MGHPNRRRNARVACELPVRLESGERRSLHASLVDVSRTGIRVRAVGALFGLHRLSSLVQVARRVSTLLGESFHAQVDPEHLGPLIRKEVRVARMAKRDWERSDIELGCILREPLSDEECVMLGIELPPLVAPTESEADADDGTPALRRLGAHEGYRVSLHAHDRPDVRPLVARSESLTRGMVIVQVEEGPEHLDDLDATQLVLALAESYGTEVTLKMTDDAEDLWVGPAEIKEVDISPTAPRELRLGLAFAREMRADELRRLGLPAPA